MPSEGGVGLREGAAVPGAPPRPLPAVPSPRRALSPPCPVPRRALPQPCPRPAVPGAVRLRHLAALAEGLASAARTGCAGEFLFQNVKHRERFKTPKTGAGMYEMRLEIISG